MKYVVFKSLGAPDMVAVKACTSAILSWKLLDLIRKWKKQACSVMAMKETLSSFPMHFPPWQLQRLSCISKSCCKTQQATESHSGKVILPSWVLKALHFKKHFLSGCYLKLLAILGENTNAASSLWEKSGILYSRDQQKTDLFVSQKNTKQNSPVREKGATKRETQLEMGSTGTCLSCPSTAGTVPKGQASTRLYLAG